MGNGNDEVTITGNSNVFATGETGSNTINITYGNLYDISVRGNTKYNGNIVTSTGGTTTIEVIGGIENVISGDVETYYVSYQDYDDASTVSLIIKDFVAGSYIDFV